MIVALAGRPNVGKSSLFNRLVGRRRALVWNRPGVTRDIVRAEWELNPQKTIELWDLAGWGRLGLSFQNIRADQLADVDLILLVIDGSESLTPEDSECIESIRKLKKPIIVVLNKCDKKSFAVNSHEIYSHIKTEAIPLSAETADGIDEVYERVLALEKTISASKPTAEASEASGEKSVLIVGRPNVGKSSLLNRIVGKEVAFVSEVAGTTRDVLEQVVQRNSLEWKIRDTAGVRKKARIYKSDNPVEIFSVVKTLQELKHSDFALFVIEPSHDAKLTSQDKKLLSLIKQTLVPTILLINKWDLYRKKWTEDEYKDEIKYQLGDLVYLPIQFVSAKTGFRVEKIFQTLLGLERKQSKITTSRLNRWLHNLLQTKSLRIAKKGTQSARGRTQTQFLHINYMVQTSTQPMTFRFFCNAPHAVAEEDKKYFENQLRKQFHLHGIPLRLQFAKKTGKAPDYLKSIIHRNS